MNWGKRIVRGLALAAGVGALAGMAQADIRTDLPPWSRGNSGMWQSSSVPNLGRRESLAQWGLPPEQRQQMRQQMRDHWQQMPPETREIRRQENRERWQSQMPWEERQRIRDDIRERGSEGRHGSRGDRR